MERIHHPDLLVLYKSKELLEEAAANGEQDRIRREFFEIVKKYDTYNFITPEKHLAVYFDCRPYHHFREWSDKRWEILDAE
jgi:hypothetical protein